MLVSSISELAPVRARAIIVNVGTKEVTTLALLSALRYTDFPILIVDLESTDQSMEFFQKMAQDEPRINIFSGKLQKHGYVLDGIFSKSRDEFILLIDSDLEITDANIVGSMLSVMEDKDVFGSGAIHGPEWLSAVHGYPDNTVLYRERPWIPFTMLRVSSIRRALEDRFSFINRWVPNEFVRLPWLARLLSGRFFLPVMRKFSLNFLRIIRRDFDNYRPAMVCCDTGADMFCHLKYDLGLKFVDFNLPIVETKTNHYHGVTRRKLKHSDGNSTDVNDIMHLVYSRLRTEYGIDASFFNEKI